MNCLNKWKIILWREEHISIYVKFFKCGWPSNFAIHGKYVSCTFGKQWFGMDNSSSVSQCQSEHLQWKMLLNDYMITWWLMIDSECLTSKLFCKLSYLYPTLNSPCSWRERVGATENSKWLKTDLKCHHQSEYYCMNLNVSWVKTNHDPESIVTVNINLQYKHHFCPLYI